MEYVIRYYLGDGAVPLRVVKSDKDVLGVMDEYGFPEFPEPYVCFEDNEGFYIKFKTEHIKYVDIKAR